jgi:hypothetical protein
MIEHRNDFINDNEQYEIIIRSKETGDPKYITLTGADIKKLILILNLSIGNLPNDAPDVTEFVKAITKGIGFQTDK